MTRPVHTGRSARDHLPTIRAKTRLVIDQGLGGIMIWPLNHDAPGRHSLLNAIHETLTAGAKEKAAVK